MGSGSGPGVRKMPEDTSTEDTPERALLTAQLEHVRLENKKRQRELAAQGRRRPWYELLIQVVPLFTTLVAIAGFVWGVVQYSVQESKNREAQRARTRTEQENAEREFMRPWLESQRAI